MHKVTAPSETAGRVVVARYCCQHELVGKRSLVVSLVGLVEVAYSYVVQQGLYCNIPTLYGRDNLVLHPPFSLQGAQLAFWQVELSGMVSHHWEMKPTTEVTTLVQWT